MLRLIAFFIVDFVVNCLMSSSFLARGRLKSCIGATMVVSGLALFLDMVATGF